MNITTQEQRSGIGGIVADNDGLIKYCYNNSDIVSKNGYSSSVGGICGSNKNSVYYTYNVGNIANYNSYIGEFERYGAAAGLIGSNNSQLNYSYTIGNIIGERAYDGIICGFNNGDIYYCYSMFDDKEYIPGSGKESLCYYVKKFVETSITQGIEKSKNERSFDINSTILKEFSFNNNVNYHFPYIKKLGMINIENNYTEYSGGNGLLNNPFRISNKDQLKNIEKNPQAYFILVNDIVLDKNELFEPIDNFYGVLDGNGYKIYNLNINENSEYVGLFRINSGKILNLDIINPNIINTQDGDAGIYAGKSTGLIYNCNTEGGQIIVNSSVVGGIAGEGSNIQYCSNKNRIEVNSLDTAYCTYVGGLSGFGGGCENSSNFGDIIVNSNAVNFNEIGGIIGSNGSAINCFNAGNIFYESEIETSYDNFSGISCGSRDFSMKNCYNVGKIEYKSKAKSIKCAGIATLCKEYDGMQNCYYLEDSVNVTNNVSKKGTKLSNLQMQNKESYKNYDFTNIWQINNDYDYPYPTLVQPMVTPYKKTFTIYGNIKGNCVNSRRISIKLTNKENDEIIVDNGYVNDDGYYGINCLEAGSYTILFLKDNLVVKSQNVIIEDKDIKIDLSIYDKGDINQDGKVDVVDYTTIIRYIKGYEKLSEMQIQLADVNEDGDVNVIDYTIIIRYIKGYEELN